MSRIEQAIIDGNTDNARSELKSWLKSESGEQNGSVGELIEHTSATPMESAEAAAVLIRCSSIEGLLQPNSTNRIERNVVSLSENALPELCDFLKLSSKEQTYIKFQKIQSTHSRVSAILAPFVSHYGDLAAVVGSRKQIMGALNHNAFKKYLIPYGLNVVRSCLDQLFPKIEKVSTLEASLSEDITIARNFIAESKGISESHPSFLTIEYLDALLCSCDELLNDFIQQTKSQLAAHITTSAPNGKIKKKYPFSEADREIAVSLPLVNSGQGRATDVRLLIEPEIESSDLVIVDTERLNLGDVEPGQFEAITSLMVIEPVEQIELSVQIEWGEVGSALRKTEAVRLTISSQAKREDWAALEYHSPYSTDVAEGDAFVGRKDRVTDIAGKILRTPMEPFYIVGQKRIGKTSLVKAAAEYSQGIKLPQELKTHYILWGSVADIEPAGSFRRLGQSIHDFIASEIPSEYSLPDVNYGASLADLTKLAEAALKACPENRFLIILDEFDEMPEPLYLSGNLAETFFANLRSLSRCKNICLALVGGENMPYIMDRQGQKLNNFSRINLSYFDRSTEWEDFRLLVHVPTKDILEWTDEAVSEIFNISSGNPYYAKLICAEVFRKAIRDRDMFITEREVRIAVEKAISTMGQNAFAHLWQDGIPKPQDEREPDILRRMRVFVAIARSLQNNKPLTIENISRYKASASLPDAEIPPTLNDLMRREILREKNGEYTVSLRVFSMWLEDVGVSHLVADKLSEEIASTALAQENLDRVSSQEVVELVECWPTYQGQMITTDKVRAWLEQVESLSEQRYLFTILQKLRFFSEPQIRERLENMFVNLRRELPVPVQRRRNERRGDIIVTYVDGPAKSGAEYAALFAEVNRIRSDLVVEPQKLASTLTEIEEKGFRIEAVVIVDDLVATGGTLSEKLTEFVKENQASLRKVKVRAFSIFAHPRGKVSVEKALESYHDIDLQFSASETLGDDSCAFPIDAAGWESQEQFERAKAICTDLGSRIYSKQPLGFGGLGLLLVLPSTVPNNSLPILHSKGKKAEKPWKPLFPRPTN
ncbi:AAA family ATPase [Sulfitobacter sp. D35]|uniref:phosphoribosyltransferase-like protein n=1 Tax=Sulfitobacter sp. D35 TaxID=3083252 RepID=UPI00296F386C|nr:AAA family ATPase [Sulfitobacter sp. D35]MDW4499159.1 AAA family ATPase [Sulfitobacter sp. D35]